MALELVDRYAEEIVRFLNKYREATATSRGELCDSFRATYEPYLDAAMDQVTSTLSGFLVEDFEIAIYQIWSYLDVIVDEHKTHPVRRYSKDRFLDLRDYKIEDFYDFAATLRRRCIFYDMIVSNKQASEVVARPSNEDTVALLMARVATADPRIAKAVGIAGQDIDADPKMRAIANHFPDARSWLNGRWAQFIGVKASTIRNTDAWKEFKRFRPSRTTIVRGLNGEYGEDDGDQQHDE